MGQLFICSHHHLTHCRPLRRTLVRPVILLNIYKNL